MHLQLKLGLASALDSLGALAWLRRRRRAVGLVLTFHRVLEDRDLVECYEPHIAMRASSFATLLELLSREYTVVPLQQLVARTLPERRERPLVAITFDDGWEDTGRVAAPLLAVHGMPATVFLCSALVDGAERAGSETHLPAMLPEERFTRVWRAAEGQHRIERLMGDLVTWGVTGAAGAHLHVWGRQLKQLPLAVKLMMLLHLEQAYRVPSSAARRFLTWDQVRSLHKAGMHFGSHTARHASLDAEDPSSLIEELTRSRAAIERELDQSCRMLAYPNGAYNRQVIEATSAAGYRYALTTEPGFVTGETDALAIPRLSIADPVVEAQNTSLHPARTRLYLQQLRAPWRGEVRRGASRSLQSESLEGDPFEGGVALSPRPGPAPALACASCEAIAKPQEPQLPAAALTPAPRR